MDDLISRQAAIDLVKDVCDAIMSCCGSHYDEETDDEVYDDIREIDAILKCNKEMRIALKNMPSAEPERKTGKWMKATGMMPPEFHGHHCCSECGNFANMEPPFGSREDLSKFCPNCGAKMVREDGEA